MSWKEAVFRCDTLSAKCIISWDAVSAIASVVGAVGTIIAVGVAYFGVIQPYRQWLADAADREEDAVYDAQMLLIDFHPLNLASAALTKRIRADLVKAASTTNVMKSHAKISKLDVGEFPKLPSAKALRKLRLDLARFKVGTDGFNKLLDSFSNGSRDAMTEEQANNLVMKRLNLLVEARNRLIQSMAELVPNTGLFDAAIENVDPSDVRRPAGKGNS
jgi:hypothetical protein